MRILIFSQYYWPENFIINNLSYLLIDRGIEINVLTGKPNYPEGKIYSGYSAKGTQREIQRRILINRVPIIPRGKNSKIRIFLNYLSFVFSTLIFGPAIVKNLEYDLIFVFAPSPLLQALPAIYLSRKRNVPLVLWVQDLWPESLKSTGNIKNKIILEIITSIVRKIYKYSDLILLQSKGFFDPVLKLVNNPKKVCYFPNLFDPNTSSEVSLNGKKLLIELHSNFSVVFAGNLGVAQDIDTIIEAARILNNHPEIKIFLVGSGNQYDWILKQKNELKLNNLILAGRYEQSDMYHIFQASDALLVTLRSDETFSLTIPSKVQAYLSARIPIIAALEGEGRRIILDSGAGICSKPGDVISMVENILKLFAMSDVERKTMGENGGKYFEENFSSNKLTDELIDYFNELVNKDLYK